MARPSRTLALGAALLALVVVTGCASPTWCPASPSAPYPEASTPAWHHRLKGDASVTDVAVDAAGGVVATGKFRGAFGVDGAVGAPPVHGSGLFVAAFDRGGAVRWLRVAGGQSDSAGLHVALDEGGGVY